MDMAFFGVFGIVLVVLAGAGVAAWLAIRLPQVARRRRAVWSSLVTGAVVTLMFLGFAVDDGAAEAWMSTAAMALIFAAGTVIALPSALVMSRMAERSPGLGDTFA